MDRLDQQVTRKGGGVRPSIGTEFQRLARLANGENFKLLRKREFFATLKFTSTCERGIEAFGAENFHGKRREERGEGWTIRDPQNLVVETRRGATWRLRKVSILLPPSKRRFSFSLPFLFFFFLIFPRSMDFLTRDRCKSWKSFPPSHDARGIFKSNLARYVYSQGRESDEFLFFFFIDARTDRISRTFAYIYGFIEAVQRIF